MDKKTLDHSLNGTVSKLIHGKYFAVDTNSLVTEGEKVSEFGMHYSYVWDKSQRLIEHSTFESSGSLRKRFKYFYDENGRLTKEIWEEDYDKPSVTKEYNYVQNDAAEIKVSFSNGKVFSEKAHHSFDAHLFVPRRIPSLTDEKSIDKTIGELKATFSNGFFNENDKANLIFEAGYFKSPGILFNRFLYKLNKKGQIIETFFERPDFDVKATAQYKYADDGHLLEECHLTRDGDIGTTISYKYFFDENNNWTKVIEFENGKAKYIYSRQIFYH